MEPNLWCIVGQDFVSNPFNENQKMMINQDYWENLCVDKIINTRKFALNVLNNLYTTNFDQLYQIFSFPKQF